MSGELQPEKSHSLSDLAMPGRLQRKCACGTQTTSGAKCRSCSEQSDGILQRKARGAAEITEVPPIVHDVLRSPGQPLDATMRAFFEPRFGRDFSKVRVHSDGMAALSAAQIGAQAWTVGSDITFGYGTYAPATPRGAGLLAHELTHVAQQQNQQRSGTDIAIGSPGDRYEREADEAASRVAAGAGPIQLTTAQEMRVQGSFLSGLLDVLLFIPRLFGLEYFPAEDLKNYLAGLKERKGPELKMFSDNKARACVSREKEFGPYDTDTKVYLIKDMLDGWTLGADEAAVITLLRGSPVPESKTIVSTIGREKLWSKFDGRNRRIIEAMTMTAADAGNPLVTRLRSLPVASIQDYVANAVDSEVRSAAQRALALQKIAAPVPVEAAIDPQGVASFQINGIQLVAKPDKKSSEERLRNRAYTSLYLKPDSITDGMMDQNNIVRSFTPPVIRGSVETTFGPGFDPSGRSGYGRGTTGEDLRKGQTSLRFHEGQHAASWFDFLRTHQPPVFQGAVGMSEADFLKAQDQYANDFSTYAHAATDYSMRMTDCPGTAATEEQLAPFGYHATICN